MEHDYIIETSQLRLREMNLADLDFLAAMLGDAGVMRYYPAVLSRDEASAWIERQQRRYAEDGHGLWLVERRDTGFPVGQVGLCIQDVEGAQQPEVGYLIHRSFWRQGFATEAATAVLDYAFEELELHKVISLVRPINRPAKALAHKLGMRPKREVEFRGFKHLVFSLRASVRGFRRSSAAFSHP